MGIKCKQHSLRLPTSKGCDDLPLTTLLNSFPYLPTMCLPKAHEGPSAKKAQYELSTTINDKDQRKEAFLTFPSHIIGSQFVAAITVFIFFTVELQDLGNLIKILLDPFQIVHQPVTTYEKRTTAVLHVWDHCPSVGRVQV